MELLPSVKSLAYKLSTQFPQQRPNLLIVMLEEVSLQVPPAPWVLPAQVSDPALAPFLHSLLAWGDFTGKWLQTSWGHMADDSPKGTKVLLLGTGNKKDEWPARCRQLGIKIAEEVRALGGTPTVAVAGPTAVLEDPTALSQFIIGLSLGCYQYPKLNSSEKEKKDRGTPLDVTILTNQTSLPRETDVIAQAQQRARLLQDGPPNVVTPAAVAAQVQDLCKNKPHVTCEILNADKLKSLGMNAILAVGGGSSHEPHLAIVSYTPPQATHSLAFVGKGLTFDTGGYSLKTPSDLQIGMKYDMSGAAVALATVLAIAELELPLRVFAVTPLCENMVDASSYRVDDVITGFSGKTIEVLNTDAEGRIALSDALSYTAKNLNPDVIVEFSTLTGAIIIALGHLAAGVFSFHNDKLNSIIQKSANDTGERIWLMPTFSEVFEDMKSPLADMANSASTKGAGSIQGAVFLREFVNDKPFVHIDIAGVANGCVAPGFPKKWSSGYGVQLAIAFARQVAAGAHL